MQASVGGKRRRQRAIDADLARRRRVVRRLARVGAGVPEVDVQTFDLLDEHGDRPAGGAHLFARIGLQAVSPAPECLDLLFIEALLRDAQLTFVTV